MKTAGTGPEGGRTGISELKLKIQLQKIKDKQCL